MSSLTSRTVLQRAIDLDLRIDSANRLIIDLGTRQIQGGRHGLAILAEFSRPRPMAEALASLEASVVGAEDWRALTSTIVAFHAAGVLRDSSQEVPQPKFPVMGYSVAPIHIKMLNDRSRTNSFLAAIQTVVRPGDVVVEVGTGTGILAAAAARAGAEKVYAIEESGIGEVAGRLFEANGLGDRITVVRGLSTEIDLPVRGDVLISEMIGDDPLGEQILEVTNDAVKRFLRPESRLIPSRIKVFGLPVAIPKEDLAKVVFQHETLTRWRSWYGFDFAPLAATSGCQPRCFPVNPYAARTWAPLSEGVPLLDLDLQVVAGSVFQRTIEATAITTAEVTGVLVYFEAQLGPGISLSSHPATVRKDNHWLSPVWLMDESLPLQAGDRFELTYTRGVRGLPDGVTVAQPRGLSVPQ